MFLGNINACAKSAILVVERYHVVNQVELRKNDVKPADDTVKSSPDEDHGA